MVYTPSSWCLIQRWVIFSLRISKVSIFTMCTYVDESEACVPLYIIHRKDLDKTVRSFTRLAQIWFDSYMEMWYQAFEENAKCMKGNF